MERRTGFHLSKWYLDCVSASGDVFIGYSAELRWKAFAMRYSSVLLRDAAGCVRLKTSLAREPFPLHEPPSTRWTSKALGVEAVWDGVHGPLEKLLYSGEGEIRWSCLSPLARGRVIVTGRAPLEGAGYVEHLTMTVPPWKLPFKELRWGRFLAQERSLVWIDWKGALPLTVVALDGGEVPASIVNDAAVRTAGGAEIALTRDAVIRSGPVVSTWLSKVPGIHAVFPSDIFRMEGSKWLERGTLRVPGSDPVGGWTIHELVRIP